MVSPSLFQFAPFFVLLSRRLIGAAQHEVLFRRNFEMKLFFFLSFYDKINSNIKIKYPVVMVVFWPFVTHHISLSDRENRDRQLLFFLKAFSAIIETHLGASFFSSLCVLLIYRFLCSCCTAADGSPPTSFISPLPLSLSRSFAVHSVQTFQPEIPAVSMVCLDSFSVPNDFS